MQDRKGMLIHGMHLIPSNYDDQPCEMTFIVFDTKGSVLEFKAEVPFGFNNITFFMIIGEIYNRMKGDISSIRLTSFKIKKPSDSESFYKN